MTDRMPIRVQMSRAKGWRKPAGVIVVDRRTRWGNRVGDPHPVFGWPMSATECVRLYRALVEPHALLIRALGLGGHDLGCTCALDQSCHADVLLELANPGWPGVTFPQIKSARMSHR